MALFSPRTLQHVLNEQQNSSGRQTAYDDTVRAEWCSGPGVLMKCWSLVLALFAGSCALAQEPSSVFRGTWTATAGATQVLRGTWSAQTSPANQNVARGSWTLLNDAGEILLEGTWSAQKTGQGKAKAVES